MYRGFYALVITCFALTIPMIVSAQAPVANFNASKTSGCSPVYVNFTDQSTGSPTSWHWDLGNAGTSTLQNPAASYINPGVYRVILTVTNSNGSSKDTTYITVNASPTVDFSADTTTACGSKSVTFTNNTTAGVAGPVSYLWDFGDGDSSTATNPTHLYTQTGNFAVSLVAVNSSGCTTSITKANYIKIVSKPTGSFTANNTSSCNAPLQVAFTNSTTNAVSYTWDFGDGNTSTSANPTHTYTSSGNYTVRLISTGVNGCSDTLTKTSYIVIGQVSANFTTGPACVGKNTVFTNTTTPGPGGSRLWSFGTGATSTSTNPQYTYNATGTYTVTLIEMYANNCNDTVTKSVTVSGNPVAQFASADTVGCTVPFMAAFTNQSTGATSYNWSSGAGNSTLTNPTFTYNSLGIYSVTLVATNSAGCTSTHTKSGYMRLQQPESELTASDTAVCANQPITFSDSVYYPLTATNYRWDFGDGSSIINCASCSTQTHSYSSTGTYTVKVVVNTSTSCSDTVTKTIYVNSKPVVNFSASPVNVCPDLPVVFTNSTTGATTYRWYFGEGNTSDSTSVTHNYDNPGTYDVTLIASNNGCRDTLIKPAYINVDLPRAKFVPTFTCSNRLAYTFVDSSISATSYYWDYGDGTTATTAGTSTHTYSTAGTYNVMMVVFSSSTGCRDTFRQNVNAKPVTLPAISASDTTVCRGENINVTRTAGASGDTYAWYVGSVFNSNQGLSPGFLLNTPGVFDLKLVVTDSAGCKDSVVKANYIKVGGTTVQITTSTSDPCKLDGVLFTDISATGAFPIVNRDWNFGDSRPELGRTTDTVWHNFYNTGPYNIKLVVTDANGCKDSVTKNSFVWVSQPKAQFYSYDTLVCAGDTVQFYNNSGGANFTSLWEFGDGNTSTATAPSHPYNTLGNYSVRLSLIDMHGCKDTAYYTDYIKVDQPTAGFTMSDTLAACPPLTVYMTNNTVGGTSYAWSFGNNNTSTNTAPSTTYTYPGNYSVKLVATNAAGCKDSVSKNVVVNGPTGTLSYSPVTGCNPLTVQFTAVSSNTNTYIWDMNNGYTQSTSNGSLLYTFTQTRKYVPTVILSDGGSCQVPLIGGDTIVVDELEADFSFATAGNLCNNDTVYFNDTVVYSLTGISTRSWDFGDGSTSTAEDPQHYYTTPGNYTVRLIVANGNGCLDTVTKTVIVNGLPTVNITASADSLCPGQVTGSSLNASGASTYSWSPATGLTCTSCVNPTANPQVHTTYVVTGTDTNGCTNTDSVTIGIKTKPVVSVNNDTTICSSQYVSVVATGANTYTWSPSTGLSNAAIANPIASPTATATYTVIGTNTSGCTDTNDVTITVIPSPTVNAGSNKNICAGDSIVIKATGADSYIWTPAGTLACNTCDSTYAKPTATTTYTVIGSLVNGCKDTATVAVNVTPLPVVNAGADTSICIGASATLQATGATNYTWTPATGLSCTSCAAPTATPTATTTYVVAGVDGNSCTNYDTVVVTVNPLPVVNAGGDATVCIGFGTQLNATGALSYIWTPAAGLNNPNIDNPFATPTSTTNYVVTGTDANLCSNKDTVVVIVNPQPVVSGGSSGNICPGDSVQLQASGAANYVWSPATGLSNTTIDNPKASPFVTTTYTVIGIDTNGCKDTATVDVSVNTPPTVSAGADVSICTGSTTALQATGAAGYIWTPATGLSCTSCANPMANPAVTTTYTVVGANGNSCKDTATVTVTVNPLPSVDAGADATVCIGFGTQLNATGAVTYSWTPTAGLNNANIANPYATPVTTTTYVVAGTDANTCSNTDTVIVNVNAQPSVSSGGDKYICPGDSAQLNASGAATYVWSPVTGLSNAAIANPKASPAATTTYTVIGTDVNGCKDTATAKVNVNSKPVVSAGANTAICTGNNTTLQPTGASSYTWSPATGLSCSTCASPVANPTTTTVYTVIGSNGANCKDTAMVTITVNPLPTVNAGSDETICIGFNAQLQATGAASYSWSPATGLSNSSIANPVASPASTTTYIVTGTDGNACSNKDTVVVNVNAQPAVSGGSNVTICTGDSTQLQATGATSYVWTPATGLSSTTIANPKASPATTTVYTVVGTNGNGCKDTATVTVTVNPLPNVNAGTDKTICIGFNTQLQATGATSYVWTPSTGLSSATIASPVAAPTATTTYIVTGTDGNSCSNKDTVIVNVNAQPSVSAGSNKDICAGDSVQLQATGATGYVWTPVSGLSNAIIANPKASPAATTAYTVVGTDANGCKDTATVSVNVKTLPTVSAGADKTICLNDTAQLQVTGAANYTWATSSSLSCVGCANPKAYPTTTTQYIVTGEGANLCIATDTIIVNVNPLPVVSVGNDTAICFKDSVTLTATGAVSYTWSPSTGLSCTGCATPISKPANNATYVVTGTDNNGCIDKDTITVTVKPLPVVNATAGRTLICNDDTTQLIATGGNGTYSWSPGATLSCTNCSNPVATPLFNTLYIVTGNLNGCKDTGAVYINMRTRPNVVAGPDKAYCEGGSDTISVAGGATSYEWTPATGLSCTNCAVPTASPTVTTEYTVKGTDANGCTNTDKVKVTVNALPSIDAGNDKTVCEGDSVQLSANGGVSYSWLQVPGISCLNCADPYVTTSSKSIFTVVGTDANGCKNTDSVSVTAIIKQPVDFSIGDTICVGEEAKLTASGGTGYSWSPADDLNSTSGAEVIASPQKTTRYQVVITQGDCFADTGYSTVVVFGPPEISAGTDKEIRGGDQVKLAASGSGLVSYEWTPAEYLSCSDCAEPTASPLRTTKFTVKGTTAYGCAAEADVTVFVTCGADQIFIPNTFTPNGDGVNDRFFPQGKGLTSIQRFSVYNRWGQLVYDAQNIPLNNPQYGWDGTYKAEPLKPDVFVYIVRTVCEDGQPLELKGDISLIR